MMNDLSTRLFRGKSLETGKWVYGALFYAGGAIDETFIINNIKACPPDKGRTFEGVRVDKRTVGQCTGLKDKRGIFIFEGDLVKHSDTQYGCRIIYEPNICSFIALAPPDIGFDLSTEDEIEIIGNAFDHIDLSPGK